MPFSAYWQVVARFGDFLWSAVGLGCVIAVRAFVIMRANDNSRLVNNFVRTLFCEFPCFVLSVFREFGGRVPDESKTCLLGL